MHQIKFYPVGNGDTTQIILKNGKRILLDFRHLSKAEDQSSPEYDLKSELKKELEKTKQDYFDVVAFTHGDKDHIDKSTEFFELLHAEKYQGEGRIKINELWVPAAMILETATTDEQSDEFVIWRQEARHRLKKGKGLKVFSKPDMLKNWCEKNGVDFEKRKHLMVDAGKIVDTFDLQSDEIEFFCHSPFIKHTDEGDDMRNSCALVFNVRFKVGTNYLDLFYTGDSKWEILEDIVTKSIKAKNKNRLEWDIYALPHHCSYLALSDEKGDKITVPKPKVKELLSYGRDGCYIVSSSLPIKDDKDAHSQTQPPHVQAKKAYLNVINGNNGTKFIVTMEEPSEKQPEPTVFELSEKGVALKRKIFTASSAIISSIPPRAGHE